MLHPYSIFFKAMWETPEGARRDDAVPPRTRRMRWRQWWSYAARRRAAADRRAAEPASPTALPSPNPAETPRGGIAG